MRFTEIVEGINMGQKALSRPPKKDYTIGLEIEVYTDQESDGDDDYENFADNWDGYNEYSIDEYINDNFENRHIFEFAKAYEPKYGKPASVDETILKDIYDEDTYNRIAQQVKLVNKLRTKILFDSDALAYFDLSTHDAMYYAKRRIHNIISSVGFKGSMETGYTFDRDMIINDENGKPEIITNIINDKDDFIMYYDVKLEDIKEHFDDGYNEHMSERMSEDFYSYSRLHKNNGGNIAYVKEFLSDNNFRRHNVVADDTHGVSAEILTPILPVNDAITNMTRMFELFDENDIETADACGLHINIGTWGDDYKNVDWLKFMIIFDAKRVLAQFGRSGNIFTIDKLDGIIKSLTQGDNKLHALSVDKMNDRIFDRIDKFSAINFKKLIDFPSNRHIEIRAPGGEDYHRKIKSITDIIKRAVRALDIASDPNAYRKEYLKILYKMTPEKSKHPFMDYVDKIFPSHNIVFFSDVFETAAELDIPAAILDKYLTTGLIKFMYSPAAKTWLGFNSITKLERYLKVNKAEDLIDTKLFNHISKAAKIHGKVK